MTLFKPRKTIIKDARWLQPLSHPPNGTPTGREMDLETIALYLNPVFTAGRARNLFLFGKPGTGKTLIVKHVLNKILEHAELNNLPVSSVYVNAGKTRNTYNTKLQILKGLGVCGVPNSGWQTHLLNDAFERFLKEKSIVIGIDEVNLLLQPKEPLLYYLSRQPHSTLILVGNQAEDIAHLENRVLSCLQPKLLQLEPYSTEEAYDILRERVQKAFYPGTISRQLLKTVAKQASETGDIRSGLAVLLNAAILAQGKHAVRIKPDDVKSAIRSETMVKVIRELEQLKNKLQTTSKTKPSTQFPI